MENKEVIDYIKTAFELKSQKCYKQSVEMLYKALEIENGNIEILYQLGELYYLMQNISRACHYLEKVIAAAPEHIESLTLLRKIYSENEDLPKALELAEKCLEIDGNDDNILEFIKLAAKLKYFDKIKIFENESQKNPKILYEIANALYQNNDRKEAENICLNACSQNIENEDILLLLGKIYYDENEFLKAKEIFNRFSKTVGNAEILNYLGLFAIDDMNFTDAIKYFSKACNINDKNSKYFFNLGNAYFFNGWYDEAAASYLSAVKISQDNLDYRYSLAYLYYDTQKYEKAQKEIDFILACDETYSKAVVLNALLKYEKKDFLGAKNDLEMNIKNNAKDDFTYLSLAKVYTELDMYEKAESALNEVISNNPDNLDYLCRLGEIYIKQNKFETALKIAQKVLDKNENYIQGYILGAKASYKMNDIAKTIIYAQNAVSLDMNFSKGYYYLGLARFMQKDYEEAEECLKRALLYDACNAEYYAQMSLILKEKGNYKSALEYIKEAVSINDLNKYKIMYGELASLNRKSDKVCQK